MDTLGDLAHAQVRQGHGPKPAQDAELGVGVAQAVEHHDADQGFDIGGAAGAPKVAAPIGLAARS